MRIQKGARTEPEELETRFDRNHQPPAAVAPRSKDEQMTGLGARIHLHRTLDVYCQQHAVVIYRHRHHARRIPIRQSECGRVRGVQRGVSYLDSPSI